MTLFRAPLVLLLVALGALFVGVTLFLPRGLVGLLPRARRALPVAEDLSEAWTPR